MIVSTEMLGILLGRFPARGQIVSRYIILSSKKKNLILGRLRRKGRSRQRSKAYEMLSPGIELQSKVRPTETPSDSHQ
jgi:hypothetical protein